MYIDSTCNKYNPIQLTIVIFSTIPKTGQADVGLFVPSVKFLANIFPTFRTSNQPDGKSPSRTNQQQQKHLKASMYGILPIFTYIYHGFPLKTTKCR